MSEIVEKNETNQEKYRRPGVICFTYAAELPLRLISALAGQKDVKPPTEIQQIAGAKRRLSSRDAPKFVFWAKIGEGYGNRLRLPALIQIRDALLSPLTCASDDLNLSSVRGQKRMGNHRSCR
jgi:hypothetical protein